MKWDTTNKRIFVFRIIPERGGNHYRPFFYVCKPGNFAAQTDMDKAVMFYWLLQNRVAAL
ncbi:hypothetical protein TH468_13590 [Thalassospira sp. MCCC 1A03138]|nr:hypothetical protein TH468_13590 [Thalassospira sp. MCCC 1A03138]